jgi:hypothetical protein
MDEKDVPDNGELRREMEELIRAGVLEPQEVYRIMLAAQRDTMIRVQRLQRQMAMFPSLTYYWTMHGRTIKVIVIVAFILFNLIYISDLREWLFYVLGLPPIPSPPAGA